MEAMDKPGRPPEVPTALEASEGKTERIATMRHELADFQRQLIDAQQRIAAELQGRAEDADRCEELEARVQEREVKAQQDAARIAELGGQSAELRALVDSTSATVEELRREVEARDARLDESREQQRKLTADLESHAASLRDSKAALAALDEELVSKRAERETERATTARLESELEASLGKHRELTELLETSASALREATTRLADREAVLATRTSERDAQQEARVRLERELGDTRRALEAGRARAQELAQEISSLGQTLDSVAIGEPRGAQPARSAGVRTSASTPPPIPGPRPPRSPTGPQAAAHQAQLVEVKPVSAVEPASAPARSRSLGVILVLGGVAVGIAASVAAAQLRDSKTPSGTPPRDDAGAPTETIPVARSVADEQPAAAVIRSEGAVDAAPTVAPSTDAPRTGIIVLPPEAEGHRIFVDGRLLRPSNGRVEVPCGQHEVQIGARSEPRVVDVACDGETALP
jgi:hypothetical protein